MPELPGESPERQAPRSALLEKYLQAYPEIDPRTVLEAPHFPVLAGGIKSGHFVIKRPDASPDDSPDKGQTVELKNVAISASGLGAFGDFFEQGEAQADRQYPDALFEVQQLLAERDTSDHTIETIFVPDTANYSAKGYFRRLTRLAQDTRKHVVMAGHDSDEGITTEYWNSYDPPKAESVDAYWQSCEVRPFKEEVSLEKDVYLEILEAIYHVYTYTTEPEEVSASWQSRLHYLADTNPHSLQRFLGNEGNYAARGALTLLDRLAYSAEELQVDDRTRSAARIIRAKMGDGAGVRVLQQELDTRSGQYGMESSWMKPMAEYVRQFPRVKKVLMDRVRAAIAEGIPGGSQGPYELPHILGALYLSYEIDAGVFLSEHLEVPDDADENYASTLLQSALRWMPQFIATVQARPKPKKIDIQGGLDIMEGRVATFLEGLLGGKWQHLEHDMRFMGVSSIVAGMLYKFNNPAHQPLLHRQLLHAFTETGSIIKDDGFARQYLRYREQYGDIPEITQHIWLPASE